MAAAPAWRRLLGRSHGPAFTAAACHGPLSPFASSGTAGPLALLAPQRRWWWDPDASRKHRDKKAFSRGKYLYVAGQVPVVLLETVRGVGRKGEIVKVKRGYARHRLVPNGLAVFGTWENIDMYADPALVDEAVSKTRADTARGRLPFDWVSEIRLRYIRWARDDEPSTLLEPISLWEVLEDVSDRHELDLLPGNVDFPADGIGSLGVHQVPVSLQFRNPEAAAGRYGISVEVISRQSQEDRLRREEMQRAVQESRRFELPQRALPGASGSGAFDAEGEFEEEV
eukprot:TRINITY_DN71876_c0_g1_i1.p2 TRINITY_DN71876_c0_g1~~TRINITY_DN71876_c0_g1_i1.p2  ORF type:complete len:284 (+),score=59.88 TRINITY_DN71876_c0_g1_i1:83-934(+)